MRLTVIPTRPAGALALADAAALVVFSVVGLLSLGVVLRALILGRAFDGREAAFLGVALTFTLLFVLALRVALGLASR